MKPDEEKEKLARADRFRGEAAVRFYGFRAMAKLLRRRRFLSGKAEAQGEAARLRSIFQAWSGELNQKRERWVKSPGVLGGVHGGDKRGGKGGGGLSRDISPDRSALAVPIGGWDDGDTLDATFSW